MNKDELLVKELVKLQVLCARYVERNTNLICVSFRDLDRIVMGNKLTITYKEAVENLKSNIDKYCNDNEYLVAKTNELYEEIIESEIKNLRFGIELQRKFVDLEQKLDDLRLKVLLYMTNGMVGINKAAEITGVNENTLKRACQDERLLNTQKIGKTWIVSIHEVRQHWNIPDLDETHLYKDWEY